MWIEGNHLFYNKTYHFEHQVSLEQYQYPHWPGIWTGEYFLSLCHKAKQVTSQLHRPETTQSKEQHDVTLPSTPPLQLHQGKHKLRLDSEEIQDLTVPPVALSWPLVSVQLTQLRCVSSRGECWNALTELPLRTQSLCFLQRKQRQSLGAEEISLVLHNPLQYLCGDLENISVVSFPPPEHRWKSLLCTHTSLTHTLHPGGPGCPFGSHGTAQQTHPEEPFQSNTKEQSTRILLNSTHVSFLFSWNWVHLSHLPFLSQTTLGEVEGLFWVNSQLTTKLENNSCIYLSTASKQFLFPSTTSHCPSVPHFLPGQHHLYILAP